eukprot:1536171-Amphidinium_carterae.1
MSKASCCRYVSSILEDCGQLGLDTKCVRLAKCLCLRQALMMAGGVLLGNVVPQSLVSSVYMACLYAVSLHTASSCRWNAFTSSGSATMGLRCCLRHLCERKKRALLVM